MKPRLLALVLVLVVVLGASVWVTASSSSTSDGDPLTTAQRAWLDEHGPLRVGFLDLAPVSIVADGEVVGGWAYEVIQLIGLKVGATIEPVIHPDRAAQVAALAAGEIDVIGIAGARPDLAAVAAPTTPLSWTPIVFVVNDDRDDVGGPEDLAGGTVSTISGSPMVAAIAEGFPELTYVETPNPAVAVRAVSEGELDAFVGPLAIIGYLLQQQELHNVRPVGRAISITETSAWAPADGPVLGIVQAGRDLISPSELRVIHVRWTGFDLGAPPPGVPTWVWQLLALAAGLILTIGLFALYLRRRIALATEELREHKESLEVTVAARTEELAETNARLRRSNSALADFAGVAAHDLRSPVAAIAGLASALKRGIVPADAVGTSLERIENSARRVTDMVQRMLDESLTADLDSSYETTIDAESFEGWLRDLTGVSFAADDAVLVVDIETPIIDTSVGTLKQTVSNLIDNALKYGRVDGQRLKVGVNLRRDGSTWTVFVDDNGPGIPEDQREAVFERGYQDDGSAPGAGFGLGNCRQRALRHGGDLVVLDAPGGGTRMRLTLPTTAGPKIVRLDRLDRPASEPVAARDDEGADLS